ncbi:MAG: DUF4350 domain-containing protein [Cyanobacteria bacterium HKST-UBA02]|nr:DUF4350 domain-containing protein [Cyanobacteria bacterium HKST-UBA02]
MSVPRKVLIQLAVLIAVSCLVVYCGESYRDQLDKFFPESRLLASTYNRKPSGLSGLYDLSERMGLKVDRFEVSYRQLKRLTGMLVIIAPVQSLPDYELKQILDWVKKGNDLVYLDQFNIDQSRQILEVLDLKVRNTVKELVDEDLPAAGEDPVNDLVGKVRVSARSRLSGGTAIVADNQGIVLARAEYGKGRVYVGATPALCNNGTLADQEYWGNFQLLENIFHTAHGTIYFDERAHGYSSGTNVFCYLSRSKAAPVAAQIGLIILLMVFSEGQRFGKARSLEQRRKISNLEFINGLTNAYKRARANTAVLDILFQSFRNRLSRDLGVSPHESSERLADAWEASPLQTSEDLRKLLTEYEQLMEARHVSDDDLKSIITACDKITTTSEGK